VGPPEGLMSLPELSAAWLGLVRRLRGGEPVLLLAFRPPGARGAARACVARMRTLCASAGYQAGARVLQPSRQRAAAGT